MVKASEPSAATPALGTERRWRRVVLGILIAAAIAIGVWQLWLRTSSRDDPLAADCMRGVARACYKMGAKLSDGDGVPQDKRAAANYFVRGCQGGDMLSCWTLAEMHYRGEGVPEDKAQAAKLFEEVCGHAGDVACHELALMLRKGDGVPPDPVRAEQLLKKACERGVKDACTDLQQQPR
jgi:TPR repeat protein